jgi:uncharacterized protein (TIGR03435 family)
MTRARQLLFVILATLASSPLTFAQPPAPPPTAAPLTFEIATIKPTARTDGAWRLQPIPDGYTGMDVSLFKLVQEAYGVFDAKLVTGGPPWIDRDKFDLEAKFNAAEIPNAKNLPYRQRADMLQPLLADRFHLKVHFEKKEFPVFNLVIAKGGPKIHESRPATIDDGGIGITCHSTATGDYGCTIANLVGLLRYSTGRTVIDKTGLTGRYDYFLHASRADSPNPTDTDAPSVFTAVQEQLGLKLEPATAPLDVLVIDSAEKPTAN